MRTIRCLIFLDFDGVLNDPYWLVQYHQDKISYKPKYEFDPKRVAALKELCDFVNGGLVLSSSWNMREGLTKYFSEQGFTVVGRLGYYENRSEAIERWRSIHHAEKMRYMIIDDEKSEYSNDQLSHLLRTNYAPGFIWTKENIKDSQSAIGLSKTRVQEWIRDAKLKGFYG